MSPGVPAPSPPPGRGDPAAPRPLRGAPEQRQMALVAGLAFFLYYTVGTVLEVQSFRWGLIVSEILFIAGPVLLAVRWFYLDPRSILPVRRPAARALLATAVGVAGMNHLLSVASALQESVFPTPEWIRLFFEKELLYRGPGDFAFVLAVFAVVPAICEEILFRGFLQAGFVRAFESAPVGIALTALVFAAFHLDPWRFAGVLALGLFLGWLAHRTGSLTLPIVGHALNNTLSVVETALSGSATEVSGSIGTVLGAALLVAAAIWLLRRRT